MHDPILGTDLPGVGVLAFLGDAVHTLYIRNLLVKRGIPKSGELSSLAQTYVSAEAQAAALSRVEPLFLPDEADVARRAKNSHLNKPKHATHSDYHAATAFEAVLGMLFWLGDSERIQILLDKAYQGENT